MDVYSLTMYCLSSFGFFIIIFSMYLLISVPTKMSSFSRFVIHGHDLSSAFAQIYLTIGFTPHIILPCDSGYGNGLLNYFNVMSTITQAWTTTVFVALSGSFSLLLTINRALGVSVNMSETRKKLILKIFFAQLGGQLIIIAFSGVNMNDGGLEARHLCQKMIKDDYPIEMYTKRGLDMQMSNDLALLLPLSFLILFIIFYTLVAGTCGIVLIRSIHQQGKFARSSFFLASRKISVGVVYFGMVELIGLGLPIVVLCICGIFNLGTVAVSHYAFISISIYPIFGPYYVLMSNREYSNKIKEVKKNIRIWIRGLYCTKLEAKVQSLYSLPIPAW